MLTKDPKLAGLLLFAMALLYGCVDNKMKIYSETRYKPISKVETEMYKSPQERAGQDKDNALGLSISGGGSRAQYFGLGVLLALDEIRFNNKTFLREVDYFSTVSGGGFAAGYYMTLKKHHVLDDYATFFDFWKSNDKDSLQEFIFLDAKPGIVKLLIKTQRFEKNSQRKKFPDVIDHELLQFGKKYRKEIRRLTLEDFFISKNSTSSVTLPMFVTNGTIYNNGERFPFMPHIISDLKIEHSLLPPEKFVIKDGYGLPLSYAISGSSAFPGLLPMLKFTIQGEKDKVIRVIDGGAVDNLGFTTLFELLHCDQVDNKKALIVDCGGLGSEVREQDSAKVGVKALLKKSLLYTVDINLLYSADNIKYLSHYYSFNNDHIKRIGFSTIKNKFIELEASADPATITTHLALKARITKGDLNWENAYREFAHKVGFSSHKDSLLNVSTLSKQSFQKFNMTDVFLLYELSSQVETKVKIFEWEKEILVLAGRYAAFLNEDEIKQLIQ